MTTLIIEARTNFHRETMRYLSAQNYFLAATIIALEENEDLKSRYTSLKELVQPTYKNPFEYVNAQLFVAWLSSFEVFLQDVITMIVKKYPKKLGSTQFRLTEILDTQNHESLISKATTEYLNRLMYKKPKEYLADICDLTGIDKTKLEPFWPTFVEAKARRDLGMHANWICNEIYLRKVSEVGLTPNIKIGESAIPDGSGDYCNTTAAVLNKLSDAILEAIIAKYGTEFS